MKKLVSFIKENRTGLKTISMILVLALMVQTVSIAVTAITESGLSIDEMDFIDDSSETMPSIVGEVESKRDQYTKVYELSDGSFYEVISNDPIHKNVGGQWEEPTNNMDIPESVDEVTSYCDELVDTISEEQNDGGASTFSYNVNENIQHLLGESYVVNSTSGATKDNMRVTSTDRLFIKLPESALSYSNTNQITVQQQLFVECIGTSNSNTARTLYAYGILEGWQIKNSFLTRNGSDNPVGADSIKYQSNILDYVNILSTNVTCCFDITEICNQWNKGVLDNNGIVIKTTELNTKTTITKCYVTRRYLVVDAYDNDFTYHSINMGEAGQVLVNDFTNTITIQRNEMYYPAGEMPINLYRYFDFSKTYVVSNPSGTASHWNYECPLVNETELVTAWHFSDGRTIRFTRKNTNQNKWYDDQGENYVLHTEGVNILSGNYYNAKITSPDGLTYTFGSAGKIKRIDDSNGNYITVTYNETSQPVSVAPQDYITRIENNSGYAYVFNYSYYTDSVVPRLCLSSISFVDENDTTVIVDNTPIVINYEYTSLPNNDIALTKVEYPHTEDTAENDILTVEYIYDDRGRLIKIVDIDNRCLEIDYTGEVPDYLNQSESNPDATKTIDNYPSAFLLTEKVLNTEDSSGDEGSQQYLTKSFIKIGRHHTYRREFTNHLEEKEIIHYNQQLKLLYYTNDNGESYYADYGINDGELYVSQIVSPEDATSLNDNGDFEIELENEEKPAAWYDVDNSMSSVDGELAGTGEHYLRISGSVNQERYVNQIVSINGNPGDIIVVGGHARTNSAVPTAAHFFGIEVYKVELDIWGDYTTTDELLYSLAFDPTFDKEVQFRLGAFELTENIAMVEFRFVYSYQSDIADFDNALIYKSSEENVTFFEPPTTENEDDSENDDDTENNNPTFLPNQTEILSDGTDKMISRYDYSSNSNFLMKHVDNSNITTKYAYDTNTGLLTKKEISDGDYSSTLIDNYSYNAMGALKEVSRVLEGTENTTGASYTYENGRISSVVHNNMTYKFDYNSYGDLKSIVMVTETDEIMPLVSYDYTANTNQITYSNEKVIKYVYENGRVVSILDCSDPSSSKTIYCYEYDTTGNISKIKDYASERVIDYSNNSITVHKLVKDGNNETNGELLYSKEINTDGSENLSVFSASYSNVPEAPQYNDELMTTEYSSNIYMGDSSSAELIETQAVCDYFGRIKKSSAKYNYASSPETHSIVNESVYKKYRTQLDGQSVYATTNLLDKYISTVSNENEGVNTERNKFVSTYEYDSAGRITHIYYNDNNSAIPTLAYFYRYDIAGQLITEVDYSEETYTEYSYDSYGNITKKSIFSTSDTHIEDNEVLLNTNEDTEDKKPPHTDIEYKYYDNFGDVLEKYGNKYIYPDEYGNPDKYYKIDGDVTEAFILDWEGNQLKTVKPANDDSLYEYKYDAEGNRTKKIIYTNVNNDSLENAEIEQVVDYIWDDDKLCGYRICMSPEADNPIMIEAIILYDELGNPIGLKYNMDGLTTNDEITYGLAEEDIFWFVKDGQGNVKAIYSEKTEYTIGCSIINNQLSINFSESFTADLEQKISEIEDNKEAWRVFFAYALALQSAPLISIDVAQATHHSYIMDVETGLYYCQNRYYSPEYGRFINVDNYERVKDDLENPFNANPFVYNNNDPVNNKINYSNKKSSSKAVGMQIELSKSLFSSAEAVGMEIVYDSVKDELFAYYYSDVNANKDYTTRAIQKVQKFLNEVPFSSNVSLKSLATIFKINNSASISYFDTQTDKQFVWPSSYLGIARIKAGKTNGYRGYVANGNGYRSKGICYYPTSNHGFAFNDLYVKYKKIEIESPVLKNFLSENKNNIIEAIK